MERDFNCPQKAQFLEHNFVIFIESFVLDVPDCMVVIIMNRDLPCYCTVIGSH